MSAQLFSSFQVKLKTNNQFKNSIFSDVLFTAEKVDFYQECHTLQNLPGPQGHQ